MLTEKLSSTEDLFTSKLLTPTRSLEMNKSSVEEESLSVSIDIIKDTTKEIFPMMISLILSSVKKLKHFKCIKFLDR